MFLNTIALQNFRSYTKATFAFTSETTFVVGPNTVGKSNLLEAIFFLTSGKSFRAEKDIQCIQFGKEIARVKGSMDETTLEVILTQGFVSGKPAPLKRYLVNGVPKRRVDFSGHLSAVLFAPSDLDMIIGGPTLRRRFLDAVLEQVDRGYRVATTTYEKALRQRNALLQIARETGKRSEKQFIYWDELLITNGQIITKKREAFITFINEAKKDVFACTLVYDHSLISEQRLLQYKDAEMGSGVTLVGPHRDDFHIVMAKGKDVKTFASRGQQRLVVLQLKMLQLTYMENALGFRPLLLLDDIFSELDAGHIELVMSMIGKQQTIVTTTHGEFIGKTDSKDALVIKLG